MKKENFFGINEWDNHSAFEIANVTKFAIVKENESAILIGGFNMTPEGFCMGYGFRATDAGFGVVEVQPVQDMAITPKTLFEPEFKAVIIPAPAFLEFMLGLKGLEPIKDFGEAIISGLSEN